MFKIRWARNWFEDTFPLNGHLKILKGNDLKKRCLCELKAPPSFNIIILMVVSSEVLVL